MFYKNRMKTILGSLVFVKEAFPIVLNYHLTGIMANPDLLSQNVTQASSNNITLLF